MDPRPVGLQQVHRPIPPIGGLEHTSGSGPASATAAAIANGSFATRPVASFSPVALIRTTTKRRR
jgi:hypothetical protein